MVDKHSKINTRQDSKALNITRKKSKRKQIVVIKHCQILKNDMKLTYITAIVTSLSSSDSFCGLGDAGKSASNLGSLVMTPGC